MNQSHDAALRNWARGLLHLTAATELLLRIHGGRFAAKGRPWIHVDGEQTWIEFEEIEDSIGAYSGGERRILRIIASIGGGCPVNLSDGLTGMDSGTVELVIAAIRYIHDETPFPE